MTISLNNSQLETMIYNLSNMLHKKQTEIIEDALLFYFDKKIQDEENFVSEEEQNYYETLLNNMDEDDKQISTKEVVYI